MNLAIIIYSGDPETIWNGLRLANFAKNSGDEVKIFLLGAGVETELLGNDNFNVHQQVEEFTTGGGEILACGNCLDFRKMEGTKHVFRASLAHLHQMIKESDRTVTF